jgi:diguanylate cyclase (GGDEF)-like protein/PAS domain S-box-containing protein
MNHTVTPDSPAAANSSEQTSSTATSAQNSVRLELIGLVVFLSVFMLGKHLFSLQEHALHWWADMFWTAAAGFTALRCFTTARRQTGTEMQAWRLFGLGCLAWFGGMLAWDYQELVLGIYTPFPSWSDLGYYLFAALFGMGFVHYHGSGPRAPLSLLEFSQFGIFICCIVLSHLVIFAVPLQTQETTTLYLAGVLAYPALYMALLIHSVTTLWQHVRGPTRHALGLVVAGITVHALANSLYAYGLLGRTYQAGNYLDVAWLIGLALIYWGAAAYPSRTAVKNTATDEGTARMLARLIPIISIGITILVILAFNHNLQPTTYEQMFPAAILLMLFVALREWASSTLEAHQAAAIRRSEAHLRQMFSISPVITAITRLHDGMVLDVNDAYVETTGYRRDELIGRTTTQLGVWQQPLDRQHMVDQLRKEGSIRGMDLQLRTKPGETREILASFAPIRIEDEDYLLSTGLDITARERTATEMRKLARALEQTADIVMITDRAGVIEYVNPAFTTVTGYSNAEAIGQRPNLLHSDKQGPEFYNALWSVILSGEVFSDVFVNKAKDGTLYYEQKTITPLRDAHGEITHFVATGRDISSRIEIEEQLRFLAQHDTLTALPNRVKLLDHLMKTLASARAHTRMVAVLFLDIDRFKNINDTLGHGAGDTMLREMGERLHQRLRAHDSIARFGGDEFVIVMDEVASANDASTLALRILEALTQPFHISDATLHITISIGISLFPNDGEDSSTLLKNADAAMYRAKERGGNNYQFYSADMGAHAERRLTLENDLRLALERDEFVLHYQPQIAADSGKIIGCEALLRWQHPQQGLVPPLEFIGILEETGLIVPVGRWVLETACTQLAAWRQRGQTQFTMAVNIASRQFQEPGLTELVTELLQKHTLEPQFLELEITESTLMQHIPTTADTLATQAKLGVRIALDDFGTGYSSLSYLRRFPIDSLKIDREFVRDIPGDVDDTAITRAIIALAQSLHLRIVAEGVETEEQRHFLSNLGCESMQGYLFSKPVPAADFDKLL